MKIDGDICIACGACLPYCPMGAISLDGVAVIDQDECVDCGVCLKSGVCPVDKVAQVLAKQGVEFEPKNPVSFLMKDIKTGKIREDILNEKVLSTIIECVFPTEKFKAVIAALKEVAKEVDTVFSVECINRADPDGSYPLRKLLVEMGIPHYINGKQCVGLGRPLAEGGN